MAVTYSCTVWALVVPWCNESSQSLVCCFLSAIFFVGAGHLCNLFTPNKYSHHKSIKQPKQQLVTKGKNIMPFILSTTKHQRIQLQTLCSQYWLTMNKYFCFNLSYFGLCDGPLCEITLISASWCRDWAYSMSALTGFLFNAAKLSEFKSKELGKKGFVDLITGKDFGCLSIASE